MGDERQPRRDHHGLVGAQIAREVQHLEGLRDAVGDRDMRYNLHVSLPEPGPPKRPEATREVALQRATNIGSFGSFKRYASLEGNLVKPFLYACIMAVCSVGIQLASRMLVGELLPWLAFADWGVRGAQLLLVSLWIGAGLALLEELVSACRPRVLKFNVKRKEDDAAYHYNDEDLRPQMMKVGERQIAARVSEYEVKQFVAVWKPSNWLKAKYGNLVLLQENQELVLDAEEHAYYVKETLRVHETMLAQITHYGTHARSVADLVCKVERDLMRVTEVEVGGSRMANEWVRNSLKLATLYAETVVGATVNGSAQPSA